MAERELGNALGMITERVAVCSAMSMCCTPSAEMVSCWLGREEEGGLGGVV